MQRTIMPLHIFTRCSGDDVIESSMKLVRTYGRIINLWGQGGSGNDELHGGAGEDELG